MDSKSLQIALLNYLHHAKPIRGAATHDLFRQAERSQIRKMKDALLLLGLLQPIPGMKTAGKMYRTTAAGRNYMKLLQGGLA